MVKRVKQQTIALSEWLVGLPLIVMAILASITSWFIAHTNNLTMSYNDSMSHVNIARLVIDNQEPGLSQLGTVWLPLNHVLPLVFIWNDWLWKTGLAGSIFSMAAYIVSVVAIYKTVCVLTKNRLAGVIGALAFATNLNILYLQTTPLTEPLYIALFTLSMLFFSLYMTSKHHIKYLLFLGFLGLLQVMTRYDGWFVVSMLGLLIGINEQFLKKNRIQETIGKVLLYGLPVAFGMMLWILWNWLIFGDPLYFATAPYSAQAQQNVIAEETGLITEGSMYWSVLAYGFAMIHNIGEYAMLLGAAGLAVFLFLSKHITSPTKKILLLAFLISPVLFNFIALFLGFSTINVPEVHIDRSYEGLWFNVRYGILALPLIAVLIGMFASWRKLAVIIALEIIIFQAYMFNVTGISTILDGTVGSSAFRQHSIADKLVNTIDSDDTVLMSFSYFSPLAFKSELDLKQFVHEGVSKKWKNALDNPASYAEFVLMSSVNDNEPLRQAFIVRKNRAFHDSYKEIFRDETTVLYQLKRNRTAQSSDTFQIRREL